MGIGVIECPEAVNEVPFCLIAERIPVSEPCRREEVAEQVVFILQAGEDSHSGECSFGDDEIVFSLFLSVCNPVKDSDFYMIVAESECISRDFVDHIESSSLTHQVIGQGGAMIVIVDFYLFGDVGSTIHSRV